MESILQTTRSSAQRIRNLRDRLSGIFVGKDEIIRLMCLSTAAREPLLLVGEPGTAKSDLVIQFCEAMGITRSGLGGGSPYFEFLLTPFTEPSEVFGPLKIDDYTQKQVYRRASQGMLQEASVAFLDEVFKANSAILNSLLTILNERKFYEGGKPLRVPLVVLFGATNEVPTSEELAALFDRFTLRVECANLRTEEELRQLIRLGMKRESQRSRETLGEASGAAESSPMPTLEDFTRIFRAALDLLDAQTFQQDQVLFLESFLRKVRAIREDGLVRLNDRKVIKLVKLMVVQALLEGRALGPEDQSILEHTWDNPDDLDGRRKLREIARDK